MSGDGPVDVVYIPGWFSNVDLIWDQPEIAPFLRRLARSLALIVFDRRGTGLSDEVAEAPHLDAMLDDIGAVMDAAGSQRAVAGRVTDRRCHRLPLRRHVPGTNARGSR